MLFRAVLYIPLKPFYTFYFFVNAFQNWLKSCSYLVQTVGKYLCLHHFLLISIKLFLQNICIICVILVWSFRLASLSQAK